MEVHISKLLHNSDCCFEAGCQSAVLFQIRINGLCCTLEPTVDFEQDCQLTSQLRDWMRSQHDDVCAAAGWKIALKNVLRHVQNKSNACVKKKEVHGVGCSGHGYGKENTVGTHPTTRTSLRLWMTSAKNRKINLPRVLIYLRQDATNTWMWRETPTRVCLHPPSACPGFSLQSIALFLCVSPAWLFQMSRCPGSLICQSHLGTLCSAKVTTC